MLFRSNWLPTLLTDSGLPYAHAATAVVLFQFAGTLGGWVIMRPLDRYGMLPCAVLYLLSIPVVASLGLPGNSETMLMVLCALAGFCVLGLHFAQVFCVSSIYPTAIRALGVGFFMLAARAGGSLGPYLVGSLVWGIGLSLGGTTALTRRCCKDAMSLTATYRPTT